MKLFCGQIHLFKDFTGRSGRVLFVALLYKLGFPLVETAQPDRTTCRDYLDALQLADEGEYGSLTEMWLQRLAEAL